MQNHHQPAARPVSATLELLSARHPGAVLIPFIKSLAVLGMALQTARNRLTAGTFPVPTCKIGSRRFVRIDDLAEFIDSISVPAATPRPAAAKKIGAPTKAERLAAEAAGLTVPEFRARGEKGGAA